MSMSTDKPGPTISEAIQEVQGIFPSDEALQNAMAALTLAGFDRADLSLPMASPSPSEATPELGAETPHTDVDGQQMRTMHTSMAASVGAMAAAGLTIATGGAAAIAIGAAVAAAAGAGALANAASTALGSVQHEERETAAAQGTLVLSARAPSAERAEQALAAMRQAGATRVETVTRAHGQIATVSAG